MTGRSSDEIELEHARAADRGIGGVSPAMLIAEEMTAQEDRRGALVNQAVERSLGYRMSRATLVGLGLSLVLHAVLLTVFTFLAVGGRGGGGGSGPAAAAPVEVAIMVDAPLVSLNEGPTTLETPGVEEIKTNVDLAPMPVLEIAGGSGLSDTGDPLGNMGDGLGGAGDGKGIGAGSGSGGSGAGGASFFGVTASGSRFAFIVDVSGSMDGERMGQLQIELANSIARMGDQVRFMIVTFESRGKTKAILGDGYLQASPANKDSAKAVIRSLRAEGGTEPLEAFEMVLRSSKHRAPDAIYFMTDGDLGEDVLAQVKQWYASGMRRVPIHCIALIERVGEPQLQELARISEGTYTYVSGGKRP